MVKLSDSQPEGRGFDSPLGPDVVSLGKGTLHEFSSLHPGGNGYPAIDSERSCQFVSGVALNRQLALCMLPGKLRMFLSVLVSAGVIILYVKRIEHAVERGYALYKCNYYYIVMCLQWREGMKVHV